jgi:hypothetical protein
MDDAKLEDVGEGMKGRFNIEKIAAVNNIHILDCRILLATQSRSI